MKAPWPREIWPVYPVRTFSPISAMKKIPTRANSEAR
jgi:hypothetical protein